MSAEKIRETVQHLRLSADALSALGVAIELQLGNSHVTDPQLEEKIKKVTGILGLEDELKSTNKDILISVLAEVRGIFFENAKHLASSTIESGWNHVEEEILQNQGLASALIVIMFKRALVPLLGDLSIRLESSTASFLDVGVGVGGISIAMARMWPKLRIVGIDPWEPALKLARKNISNAGLTDRIELSQTRVENLTEHARFDLSWFPATFISKEAILPSLKRIRDAIRPGGWVITGAINGSADPLTTALSDLRSIYWGGHPLSPHELKKFLHDSGFGDVRMIPGPPWSAAAIIVGCCI
ncbi:MAG: class I SAM-dependent methyltransferase [Nitrososphaerota archaeon]|nr:class I SAM-dependent methyltransferase [Nitrososphaerota archaeon]MDG6922487.1 class I SAM-dependent methyltransferase [Nitrososphaerota archaeon]